MWDINSQLGVIKSSSEGGDIFSQNCKFISQNTDFTQFWIYKSQLCLYLTILRKKRQNCEFVSVNCEEKKTEPRDKKSQSHFFLFICLRSNNWRHVDDTWYMKGKTWGLTHFGDMNVCSWWEFRFEGPHAHSPLVSPINGLKIRHHYNWLLSSVPYLHI